MLDRARKAGRGHRWLPQSPWDILGDRRLKPGDTDNQASNKPIHSIGQRSPRLQHPCPHSLLVHRSLTFPPWSLRLLSAQSTQGGGGQGWQGCATSAGFLLVLTASQPPPSLPPSCTGRHSRFRRRSLALTLLTLPGFHSTTLFLQGSRGNARLHRRERTGTEDGSPPLPPAPLLLVARGAHHLPAHTW